MSGHSVTHVVRFKLYNKTSNESICTSDNKVVLTPAYGMCVNAHLDKALTRV